MSLDFNFSKIEGYDWDKGNLGHIKKHNIDYKECEEIFFNKPLFISKDEEHSKIEERLKVLGITNSNKLIFLSLTIRNNKIRVVTARIQNKKERVRFKKMGGEED